MSDEQQSMELFADMHPYRNLFQVFTKLPAKGVDEDEILKEVSNTYDGSASKPRSSCACVFQHSCA